MILGTAGLTALQCAFVAKLTREELLLGEKVQDVIVTGASGGVGSIAGKELPYAPAHTMMLGLEHNFNNKFNSRIDFRSVSKSYTDFENFEEDVYGLGIAGPIPMHQVWNLSSTYKITSKFNVSLNIKNLFDELYIGSRLHSNPGKTAANQSSGIIIAPGRQINISFEYSFD